MAKKKTIDIDHLAKLAKLTIDNKSQKHQKQIGEIIHYFDQLSGLDISSASSTSQVIELNNVSFEDGKKPNQRLETRKGLKLKKSVSQESYFLTKKVKWEF